MKSLRDRFESKIAYEPMTGCWLWDGALYGEGRYGAFTIRRGKTRGAHRVSYLIHNGYLPDDMHVCHSCDTPSCVNPDHLFLGTHSDNMADRGAKGRTPTGERHGQARLSEPDVARIREASGTLREIADRFGVSKTLVWRIRRGEIWRGSV